MIYDNVVQFSERAAKSENDMAIEYLRRTGTLLYNGDWIEPLAEEMEISPGIILDWLSRKTPLTMSDGIWPNVFYVLGLRGNEFQGFFDEVYIAFRNASKREGKWGDDLQDHKLPPVPQYFLV